MSADPRVVAHRGASRLAPENTIAAIALGYELGAAATEIDVHLSRDREVVVIHDYSTARTTGVDRPVAEQTLEELERLDAGSWFSDEFRGERIPTLSAIMSAVPHDRTLFVEIKSMSSSVAAITAVIENDPRVAVQSFSQDVLAEMKRLAPGVPTYWLVASPLNRATDQRVPIDPVVVGVAERLGCRGIALDARCTGANVLQAAHGAGLDSYMWTVDDAVAISRFASMGAAWIETNDPEAALKALG